MIAIKSLKHIVFLYKNKAMQSRFTKNDLLLIIILILLIVVSFYSSNLYTAFSDYTFLIPIIMAFLYISMMCLTIFEKMPESEYRLFKYLKFTEIDFWVLAYLKTFVTNISMSIVVSNFLIHWRIHFLLSFLLVFIFGNIFTFYLYKLIVSKTVKNNSTVGHIKKSAISNYFFKNKYIAFFYETFFGYTKGKYEYIDMLIIVILILLSLSLGVSYKIPFIISAYVITFFASLLSIDVYMVHFKNRVLSIILGIKKTEIYKMSLATVITLSAFFNLICTILYCVFIIPDITYILISIISIIYFTPIQYALIKIADKKLNTHISVMSAFLTDIMISFLPIINLIYAGAVLAIKRNKEVKELKYADN